jgi:hypothetical protein
MSYTKCEIEPAKPIQLFDFYADRYNIQNALVVQYDFPTFVYINKDNWEDGDFFGDTYSDRFDSDLYSLAYNIINQKNLYSLDNANKIPKKKLLEFANFLYADCLKDGRKITGVRILRFTNVSNGYPYYRIDAFAKSPKTPDDHKLESSDRMMFYCPRGSGWDEL